MFRFELRLLSSLAAGAEASICYGEEKPNSEVREAGRVVVNGGYGSCGAGGKDFRPFGSVRGPE